MTPNNEEEAHLLTTSMEPGELPDPARRGRDGKEVVGSKGFDRSSSTSPRAGLSLKSRGSLPWGNRDREYGLDHIGQSFLGTALLDFDFSFPP